VSDVRNTLCENCELPWLVCGCDPADARPIRFASPADEPERGEPNCDLCPTGRMEEKCGNGFAEWVCDRCGHFSIDVYDDDDEYLQGHEETVLRVNLIEAAKLR